MSAVALAAGVMLSLTACDSEKFENIQVYKYTVSCSNHEIRHEYNKAVDDATDSGYADHDKNARVIAACDSVYAAHGKLEKYRTVDSCTVEIKRKYVSLTEGTGSTRVASYSYPIK